MLQPSDARADPPFDVDGETFEVRPREQQPGFDVDWVTGPNPGYGFSCGAPMVCTPGDQVPDQDALMDDTAIVATIRSFLEQIDPGTGYVAD